jgi:hypothetical protein
MPFGRDAVASTNNTGGVHEAMQGRAAALHLVGQTVHLQHQADLGLQEVDQRIAGQPAKLLLGAHALVAIAPDNDHMKPALGEPARHLLADAVGAAGDERRLMIEKRAHCRPCAFVGDTCVPMRVRAAYEAVAMDAARAGVPSPRAGPIASLRRA